MRPHFHIANDPKFRYPRAGGTSWSLSAIAAAYSFPQFTKQIPDQKIGIIELGGGYQKSDIDSAFLKWGMPAPIITDINIGSGRNSPGQDADGEVVLDIEIAAGIYSWITNQSARINVYFAGNNNDEFGAAVQQAGDDGCSALSISWGGPEIQWGQAAIAAFGNKIKYTTDKGCPVWCSSGDNNSSDGIQGINVDYPGSDPNAISCGGTSKTRDQEIVWNNGPTSGTGGGYSRFIPVQAHQIGAPAGPGRMVPDLAGLADPQTGWEIFLNGQWTVIGGTSAVSPMYSGLFAALAGARQAANLPRLVNLGALIWSHPALFRDIISGNNGQWRAVVGPDPTTGLGVIIGTAAQQTMTTGGTTNPPPLQTMVPLSQVISWDEKAKALLEKDFSHIGNARSVIDNVFQQLETQHSLLK